jgi:hypothetical protein
VSLVDATLGNGQPCLYPQIAGAAQDDLHTGASNQAAGAIVDLDFSTASNMLDLIDGSGELRVYACATAQLMVQIQITHGATRM